MSNTNDAVDKLGSTNILSNLEPKLGGKNYKNFRATPEKLSHKG